MCAVDEYDEIQSYGKRAEAFTGTAHGPGMPRSAAPILRCSRKSFLKRSVCALYLQSRPDVAKLTLILGCSNGNLLGAEVHAR